jgi:Spy/CpxP family protein refolding chaperone
MGGMMGRDLNQILNLTPEQQTKVQEIYQKAREERMQQRQAGGQAQRPDRQKMQELRDELNKAAEAGDDAQVEKLQEELQGAGMGAQFRQQQAKTNDQIEQILTPEQKVKFREYRTLSEAGLPPSLMNNPDALQKAVMKISTLTDIQKNQLEAMFERYNRDASSPSATPESKQAAALKVASDVVKELKPSQKVLLTSSLRPQMGPGGRNRPSRGGEGGAAPVGGGENATPASGE